MPGDVVLDDELVFSMTDRYAQSVRFDVQVWPLFICERGLQGDAGAHTLGYVGGHHRQDGVEQASCDGSVRTKVRKLEKEALQIDWRHVEEEARDAPSCRIRSLDPVPHLSVAEVEPNADLQSMYMVRVLVYTNGDIDIRLENILHAL